MAKVHFWKPGTVLSSDREIGDGEGSKGLLLVNKFEHYSLSQQRQVLPIAESRNHFLYCIERYRVVVLVSETGTGKSTQLPQYLYEFGWTSPEKAIVCTQPRRLAVLALSSRVALEVGCNVGDIVGFSMRFESSQSSRTRIKYCTDGALLREISSDPLLSRYSVVMVDEVT
jgi:ATP-dependent RNA helicase DDX35